VVVIVVVKRLLMKFNRILLIKGLSAGMELLSFFVKKDVSKHTIPIIAVVDAGKNAGITVLATIDAFKDRKLSPEEALELSEHLTVNKRTLDNALTYLIRDLRDYAIDQTKGG